MQNHLVFQIRQHVLAIRLLRSPSSFIKDLTHFFLLENGLSGQQNVTCGAIRPPSHEKEPPTTKASFFWV